MHTTRHLKHLLAFLCGMALLTACAPKTTVAPSTAYSNPFAYCAGVGTIDQVDARYTGPQMPESIVKGVMKASGASADAPVELFSKGTFWRCMDGKVYACFVGANLPCDSKANTSKEPTPAMNEYCKTDPNASFIPAAATGHDTIYSWACKDGKAVVDKQVFQVDQQGYIQSIWYAVTP